MGTVAQALATSSAPAGQHLVAEHPTQGHGDDEGADAHWYSGSEMVQWLIMAEIRSTSCPRQRRELGDLIW
jgi:hypothetical protein